MVTSWSVLVVALSITLCLGQERIVFEENFDTLDETRWEHTISTTRGGNNEFQIYRNDRRNSYIEGGILKIKPTMLIDEMSDAEIRNGYINLPYCTGDPCVSIGTPGGDCIQPAFSAKLISQHKIALNYGRIEVRAKLPRGDWLWPAIWMLPDRNVYGGWPASGEIDIVESRGNRNYHNPAGVSVGVDTVGHTLHWGPRWPYNGWGHSHWEKVLPSGQDFSDDFHVFEIERRPDRITFRIDGEETGNIAAPAGGFWTLGGFNNDPGGRNPWAGGEPMAPFDQEFFIVLNVAVGGSFFDDSYINADYPRPWNWFSGHPMTEFYDGRGLYLPTWDRPTLEIDYIRAYE